MIRRVAAFDRDGQPGARDRGIDAGHGTGPDRQRATGVAGSERRAGLDDVLDHPAGSAAAHRQRAPQPADHAGGHRRAHPVRGFEPPARRRLRPSADRLAHLRPQPLRPSTGRAEPARDGARRATLVGMTLLQRLARRARALRDRADAGMTTAEYAVGTIAAVAFAAVLYRVVRSSEVQAGLASLIHTALTSL